MKSLGKILLHLREAHGYSQAGISSRLGIKLGRYQHWEAERADPDIEMIVKIADFYDITVDELIGKVKPEKIISTTMEAKYKRAPENIRKAIDVLLG